MRIREYSDENKVFFNLNEDGEMISASWAFGSWLEGYARYGIVPGINIDCKAIKNRFGLPLLTIYGRSNEGFVMTYFMEYISCETEGAFIRVLSEFKSSIWVPPSLLALVQNVACLNATQTVFPLSYIEFDV